MASNAMELNLKLASAAEDIKIWSPGASLPSHHIFTNAIKYRSVHWSSDLQRIVCVPVKSQHMTLATIKPSEKPEIVDIAIKQEATYARFSHKSSSVVGIGSKSGTVQLWDMKHKKSLKSFNTDKSETTCLCFNGNNSYLASGSAKGKIFLHNTTSGKSNAPFGHSKGHVVQDIHYSYFQKSLLGAVYYDGMVTLWDVNTRQVSHNFADSHNAPATGIRFSSLNPLLMISVGLDKKVLCYDVNSKTIPKSFSCEFPVTCFDFNEDGHTLALGSSRGKILTYDLRYLAAPKVVVLAHATSINCLAFQSALPDCLSKPKRASAVKSEISTTSDSVGSDVSTCPSIPDIDLELSVGKGRVSHTFDVFSPVGDGTRSSKPSDVSDHIPLKKPALAHRDSLALFSPLENSPSLGLNDTAAFNTSGSPLLRPKPPVLSRVTKSPFFKSSCSPIPEQNKLNVNDSADSNNLVFLPVNTCPSNSPMLNQNAPPKWPSEKQDNKLHCIPDMSCLSLRGMCSSNGSKISRDDMPNESADTFGMFNNTTQVMQPVTLNSPSSEFQNSVDGKSLGKETKYGQSKLEAADYTDEGHGTGVGTTPVTPEAFQTEYVRQCIEDAKEEMLDEYRKMVHLQHVQLCRALEQQRRDFESLFRKYSSDADLVTEVEMLRKQNQMLKSLFH